MRTGPATIKYDYDYLQRYSETPYSLYELEWYWHAQDTRKLCDVDVLDEYKTRLAELYKQSPEETEKRLLRVDTHLMTGIANGTIARTSYNGKLYRIYDLFAETSMGEIKRHADDGQYVIAVLLMFRGLLCNNDGVHAIVSEQNLTITNASINAFLSTPSDKPFQLVHSNHPRVTHQLAAQLFEPAWCMLVEPSLASVDDLVQTIWVERPRLLTLPKVASAVTCISSPELPAIISP